MVAGAKLSRAPGQARASRHWSPWTGAALSPIRFHLHMRSMWRSTESHRCLTLLFQEELSIGLPQRGGAQKGCSSLVLRLFAFSLAFVRVCLRFGSPFIQGAWSLCFPAFGARLLEFVSICKQPLLQPPLRHPEIFNESLSTDSILCCQPTWFSWRLLQQGCFWRKTSNRRGSH